MRTGSARHLRMRESHALHVAACHPRREHAEEAERAAGNADPEVMLWMIAAVADLNRRVSDLHLERFHLGR
jgi:hypothetical protein